MPGIDPDVICYKLSIKAEAKPVKQKPRRMNEEQSRAMNDEVDSLLQAGFIQDILPRLALQFRPREEEKWQVKGLHWLH